MKVSLRLLIIWQVVNFVSSFHSYASVSTTLYRDIQTLTSPAHRGRKAGSPEPNLSAKYLLDRFNDIGLDTKFQTFEFKSGLFSVSKGHNVVATLPCDQLVCGKKIVISAHYDHLGGSAKSYYAGANDNASGTAALIAIAEKLKNVPRAAEVKILATDAEEVGLYGAKYFVKSIIPAQYALNINLDMLAINHKNTLYALHDRSVKHLLTLFEQQPLSFKLFATSSLFRLNKRLKNSRVNWHKASDHYAFSKAGIPYIYLGMGEDKKLHTKKDTLANLDFNKYQSVVASISAFIVSLVSEPLEATN